MFAFFRRKKKTFWNEFTVLGSFVAVVVVGFMYAAIVLALEYADAEDGGAVMSSSAPRVEDYRGEAREVMTPFLSQAEGMDEEDIEEAEPLFFDLAVKTQERLLRLRVPKEERDTHLSLVLLLDQWKRALGGSQPDRRAVVDRTEQIVAANAWLR